MLFKFIGGKPYKLMAHIMNPSVLFRGVYYDFSAIIVGNHGKFFPSRVFLVVMDDLFIP